MNAQMRRGYSPRRFFVGSSPAFHEVFMELTKEEVRHVAELAKLQLSEAELEEYAGQLGQILAYAQQIRSVDTGAVPPTPHILSLTNVLADDKAQASLSREQAVVNCVGC